VSAELATLLVLRSLLGLGLPADLGGLHPADGPGDSTLPGAPLFAFHPSPESTCTGAALVGVAPEKGCLPCGFFPFGVFPAPGSHLSRRVPASRYVPSQRFARSQGLAPPGACRPCSMPVPPLGFSPFRVRSPLAEPCVLPGAAALLGLADRPGTVSTTKACGGPWGTLRFPGRLSRRRHFRWRPRFRALLPASGRVPGPIV